MDKIEIFKSKLSSANITFEEMFLPSDEGSQENVLRRIKFQIPSGREKHDCIIINDDAQLDYAVSTNFEHYKFIQGYEAIWSKDYNTIEAEISSAELTSRFAFSKLYRFIVRGDGAEDDEEDVAREINFPPLNNISVSLGHCTKEFSFLTGTRERGFRRFNSQRITLKINNANKTTHDAAKDILEKIANSIFFQIDLAFELPINLQNQRETYIERIRKRSRKSKFIERDATISEPKYEYDSEPISLYWYAKESSNMPIFQFLAYYQSIEFYFPIHSSFEAKQKIQALIKDPRFNANRDSDITKIISTIKNTTGKGFGNEREQLKSTIATCINNSELRSFLELDPNRKVFYEENIGKGLSNQKISLKSEIADLVSEVSERIYQIRCRIVHSKASENEYEALLPYSNEVKKLNFDIELIEFISRKVLVTSSRPLNL